jgi:hypothetical protein
VDGKSFGTLKGELTRDKVPRQYSSAHDIRGKGRFFGKNMSKKLFSKRAVLMPFGVD